MNTFNQIIKDYNEAMAMRGIHTSLVALNDRQHKYFLQCIRAFVIESNNIESVYEEKAHDKAERRTLDFLALDTITVSDLCVFNKGHGRLRVNGECVRVGNHTPPKGGQNILYALEDVLNLANIGKDTPFDVHNEFETLHPFTDGNGRTGRALWAWQMVNQRSYTFECLFLQQWYYQSLGASR